MRELKMAILLSGDFHGNAVGETFFTDLDYLKNLFDSRFDSIKYQIFLGDFGILWPGDETRSKWHFRTIEKEFEMFKTFPWPVLFIPGNHEPIYGHSLDEFEEIDFGFGSPVYKIIENVYYMPRGKVYNIEGHRILALGGALSIDKNSRVLGHSYWEEEYWSASEERALFDLIEQNPVFDYVISHTGPTKINQILTEKFFGDSTWKIDDQVAFLNDEIVSRIQFKEFFAGHFHQDWYYYDVERDYNYPFYAYIYRHYSYIYQYPLLIDEEKEWNNG